MPPIAVPGDGARRHAGPDRGAGALRRSQDSLVEHGAAERESCSTGKTGEDFPALGRDDQQPAQHLRSRQDLVEEPETLQRRRPQRVEEITAQFLAGEAGAVEQDHVHAPTCQRQGRGGARRTSTDDQHVHALVHVTLP